MLICSFLLIFYLFEILKKNLKFFKTLQFETPFRPRLNEGHKVEFARMQTHWTIIGVRPAHRSDRLEKIARKSAVYFDSTQRVTQRDTIFPWGVCCEQIR